MEDLNLSKVNMKPLEATLFLTGGQIGGLIRLIDDEISVNEKAGDSAYNSYWIRLKKKLAKGQDQLNS